MADKETELNSKKSEDENKMSAEEAAKQKQVQEAIELANKGPQNLSPAELARVYRILAPFNNTNGEAGAAFAMVANHAEEQLKSFDKKKEAYSPEDMAALAELNQEINKDKKEEKEKVGQEINNNMEAYDKANRLDHLSPESLPELEANYATIEDFYKGFEPFAKDKEGKPAHPEFAGIDSFLDKLEIENTDDDSKTTKEDIRSELLELAKSQAETDLCVDPAFKSLPPEEQQKLIMQTVSGYLQQSILQMVLTQRTREYEEKNKELLNKEHLTDKEREDLGYASNQYQEELQKELNELKEQLASGKESTAGFRMKSNVALAVIADNSNKNLAKCERIAKKTGFSKLLGKIKKFDAKMAEKHPKLWKMAKNMALSGSVGLATGGAGLAVLAAVRTGMAFKKSYQDYKANGGSGIGGYMSHLWHNPKEAVTLTASVAGTVLSSYFAGAELLEHGASSLGLIGQVHEAGGVSQWWNNLDFSHIMSKGGDAAENLSWGERAMNGLKAMGSAKVLGRATISLSSGAAASAVDYLAALKEKDPEKRKQLMKNARRALMGGALGAGLSLGITGLTGSMQHGHAAEAGDTVSGNGGDNTVNGTSGQEVVGNSGGNNSAYEAPTETQHNTMLLRNSERHPDLDMDKIYANLKAQGVENPEVAFYKLEQSRLLAPNDPIMTEGDTNVRATLMRAMQGKELSEADMKIIATAQNNVSNGGFYTNDVRHMGGTGYSYRPNGVEQDGDAEHSDAEHQGQGKGKGGHGSGKGGKGGFDGLDDDGNSDNDLSHDGDGQSAKIELVDVSKLSDSEKALYTELESRYAESNPAVAKEMASQTFRMHQDLLNNGQYAEAESLLMSSHNNFENLEAKAERAAAYRIDEGDDKGLIKSKNEAVQAYEQYQKALGDVKAAERELMAVKDLPQDHPDRLAAELKHAQAVKGLVHDQMEMSKADVDLYKDQLKHDIHDAKDVRHQAEEDIRRYDKIEKRVAEIDKKLGKHGIEENEAPELKGDYSSDKREAKEYLDTAKDNIKEAGKIQELQEEKAALLAEKEKLGTKPQLAQRYRAADADVKALEQDMRNFKNDDISKLPGYRQDAFENSALAKAQNRVFREHWGENVNEDTNPLSNNDSQGISQEKDPEFYKGISDVIGKMKETAESGGKISDVMKEAIRSGEISQEQARALNDAWSEHFGDRGSTLGKLKAMEKDFDSKIETSEAGDHSSERQDSASADKELQSVRERHENFERELDQRVVSNATVSLSDADKLSNGQMFKETDKLGNLQFIGKDAEGHTFKLTKVTNYGNDVQTTGVEYKLEVSKDHPLYDKLNASTEGLSGAEKFRAETNKDLTALRFAKSLNNQQSNYQMVDRDALSAAEPKTATKIVGNTGNSGNMSRKAGGR